MMTLDQIGRLYRTDKSSLCHDYCRKYEKYLPFDRKDALRILEIGVQDARSLRMWTSYYSNSFVIGIDINPDCKQYESDRMVIEIGSQTDSDFLNRICETYGPFDLIIDDGSHINSDVIFSFECLFDHVKSGGVYIIEDVCTSYWPSYGGERYKKGTTIEYLKDLMDEVNFFGEHVADPNLVGNRKDDTLLKQFKEKGYNYIGTQIESLNILNSITIITKR